MAWPEFNSAGDLPIGIHRASLAETLARFGAPLGQRNRCAQHLTHIYDLAQRANHLKRLIIFGSFITAKSEPNDVDVILIMDDAFRLDECPAEIRGVFDHAISQARYGASIFWVRPGLLIGESIDEFIAYWQTKRDGTQRGLVEVEL